MKETVIKCDRCGKEYGLDEWATVEFRGSSPITVLLRAMVGGNEEDIDLCVECRKSFRKWFNNWRES